MAAARHFVSRLSVSIICPLPVVSYRPTGPSFKPVTYNASVPRRALAVLAVLATAALVAAAAPAKPTRPALATKLAKALAVPHIRASQSGPWPSISPPAGPLLRHPTLSLVPASNAKLAVAYASLDVLGPDFRIDTTVFGEGQLAGSTWNGDLVLKGFGDPTLSRGIFGPRGPDQGVRDPAGHGRDRGRRVLLRLAAGWARVAVALLHQRVATALRPDRRPCPLPRLCDQQPGDRGCDAVPPRVAGCRRRRAWPGGHGRRGSGCDAAREHRLPRSPESSRS